MSIAGAMGQISVRTIVVAGVAQLGLIVCFNLLYTTLALSFGWIWAGFPEAIKPVIDGLRSSSLFFPLAQAVSIVPASILSGYLAGRMPDERPLLHGALSCCAWILLLILVVVFGLPVENGPHGGPPASPPTAAAPVVAFLSALLNTALSIGTPMFGVLGAVLAHQRRAAGVSSDSRQINSAFELPRHLIKNSK